MSVSYWQDKNTQSTPSPIEIDVTIIGGGIAGASCAYWLSNILPDLKVALIEKHTIAHGATGRNAGFITCGSVEHFSRLCINHGEEEALKMWKFSETNHGLLKEHIIQNKRDSFLYENNGSCSLASTKEELNELNTSADLMSKLGIKVESLNQSHTEKRLGATGFSGGIKYLDDGSIHPVLLVNEILKKAGTENFKIYENNEVYEIKDQNGSKLVHTNKHTFRSEIVILATNGYSSLLNPYFKDKIYPTRGQILATSPVARFMEAPCYANFVLDYFRQLPTGELIIGGFRQLKKDTEVGYSDEITDEIQTALEKFIKDHLPKLKEAKITHRWSGIMGFSSDGSPMIGSLPTDPQIYYIGGFTAHGLGLAFHSAKCLVDLINGADIPKWISGRRF